MFILARAPCPAQSPKPLADYERWVDTSSKTRLSRNRLQLVITFDANFGGTIAWVKFKIKGNAETITKHDARLKKLKTTAPGWQNSKSTMPD